VTIGKECHSDISIEKENSFHQRIGLEFKVETNEKLHTEHNLCGAENWKLKSIDRIYIESTAMSCWRRMEKSVGLIVRKMGSQGRKEHSTHSNIKKDKWTGYNLCKNSLPKHVIKRKIEGKRAGTRRQ
jgi:hypothetical protein